MVDFRRWTIVLAVFALFAGLASAQDTSSSNKTMTCEVLAAAPQVRAEGYTEKMGDILIKCTGGKTKTLGTLIDRVNITVQLGTKITSRLYAATGASEALLYIDSAGSGEYSIVAGYGSEAAPVLCTNLTGGCASYVGQAAVKTGDAATYGDYVAVAVTSDGTTPAPNVYQGVVPSDGSSVTFYNVPVLPPVTGEISRTFRIKNIRGNTVGLSGQLAATLSDSDSSALPITTTTQYVANVFTSLSASTSGAGVNFEQCIDRTPTLTSVVSFKELIGAAFKTRVVATTATTSFESSTGDGSTQTSPIGTYGSESGTVLANVNLGGSSPIAAGLANYGTRLKAVFKNIPDGVTLYVSTHNTTSNGGLLDTDATPTVPGNSSTATWAVLVPGETSAFEADTATTASASVSSVPVVELAQSSGTATAVWEVTNADLASETLNFGVYLAYTSDVANNAPTPTVTTTPTVDLGYAPSASTTAWGLPSRTLAIPRFTSPAAASTGLSWTKISVCGTTLLWPYVTNYPGFETGLAISNTSADPLGTANQSGTCTLYFYGNFGDTTAVTSYETAAIDAGTTWSSGLGDVLSGSSLNSGYIIGMCNFQYAHGYAAISDTGVRNFLSSYLAVVLSSGNVTTTPRGSTGETLGN